MNREIKFRGYSYAKQKWVYGSLLVFGDDAQIVGVNGGPTEVDPATVGQYTGLKNNAGTEIYEGDIIANYVRNEFVVFWGTTGWKARSLYTDEVFNLMGGLSQVSYVSCSVIGNIHEHVKSD